LNTHPHPNRNRWLIAIGGFKLLKAALFAGMGFGVINLLHKDLADFLLQLTLALRFDPENRFVNLFLERAASLNPHRLREITFALFLYAALDLVEGVGLALEQTWAEYFTLILTSSFLPWELYEIVRRATAFKVGFFLVNVFVVLYIGYIVRDRVRGRQASYTQLYGSLE
jgi:uncharacterized membrane protein (DUF2068 family)